MDRHEFKDGKGLSRREREEERVRKESKKGGHEFRPNFEEGTDFSRRLAEGFGLLGDDDADAETD